MNSINAKFGGKCTRDSVTYMFWCEVQSDNPNQFEPLELGISASEIYRIPPEKYIDFVLDLVLAKIGSRIWIS